LYGGLRPSEVRGVVVGDLHLPFDRKPTVDVRHGKWDKPREVTLPRLARNLVLPGIVGKAPNAPVYPWRRSKHQRDLDRACQLAGTRHYGLHDLRRTYASIMFEAGAPLEAVQDQMGHEDPKTTRLYQGPVRVARVVDLLETFLGA
jgi:integrase